MRICEKANCTGCGVCADACPRACIDISFDADGFLQSTVDESRCIQCGRCISVCPANHPANANAIRSAYKIRRSDGQKALRSTSGGIAALLTEMYIQEGGWVCGCGFDSNLKLCHSLEKDLDGAEKFKGSKYVQSETAGIYKQIKQCLTANEKVLFIGTPCQVSALKNFLNKDYENLLTVDLVCHGVASRSVLNQYIDRLEAEGVTVTDICFRSKDRGYIGSQENDLILHHSAGVQAIAHQKGIVLWFAAGLTLRESCYGCNFVSTLRCGDLTMADYIGQDISPEEHQYGVSTLFVNTTKGERWVEKMQQTHKEERPVKLMAKRYVRLHTRSSVPRLRRRFFKDRKRLTLEQLEQKYTLKYILPSKLTLYARAAMRRLKKQGDQTDEQQFQAN